MNVVELAKTVTAGRRGRRPLQGWCGDTGSAVIPASGRGWNPVPMGLEERDTAEMKNAPIGAFFILQAFYLIDKPLAGMMGPSASEAVRLILSPGFRMAASGLSEALML